MSIKNRIIKLKGNLIWREDKSIWGGWHIPTKNNNISFDIVQSVLEGLGRSTQIINIAEGYSIKDIFSSVTRGINIDYIDKIQYKKDITSVLSYKPISRYTYVFIRLNDERLYGDFSSSNSIDESSRSFRQINNILHNQLSATILTPSKIKYLDHRIFSLREDLIPKKIVIDEKCSKDSINQKDKGRILKVTTELGSFWLSLAMLSHMPFAFDNVEHSAWFQACNYLPQPIDWVCYLQPVDNQSARRRNANQRRQLVGQEKEYLGDPAGPPSSLQSALEAIDMEHENLSSKPNQPSFLMSMGWVIRTARREDVTEIIDRLSLLLESKNFTLERPFGSALDGLLALKPGEPTPESFNDYQQYLLAHDIAVGLPFSDTNIGDENGILAGICRKDSNCIAKPVFIDPSLGPLQNKSGSMAVFGSLGSGKSYFIKRLLLGALERGASVSVFDRTYHGEYSSLAKVTKAKSRVVTLDGNSGLDPYMFVGREHGKEIALAVLCILTRTSPVSTNGIIIGEAVNNASSMSEAIELIYQDKEARDLAKNLRVMLRVPLAQIFSNSTEIDVSDVDYLCFEAPGLTLPDKDSVKYEHLNKELLPIQLVSNALMHLVTAVSHSLAMRNKERFGIHIVDEAWALTASPTGKSMLLDAVRDGRKHNAALWLISQDPEDIGDDALGRLMGTRTLFRCDRGALHKAAELLDVEEEYLSDLPNFPTGTCFMRDLSGRVERVEILKSSDETVHKALNTTPFSQA